MSAMSETPPQDPQRPLPPANPFTAPQAAEAERGPKKAMIWIAAALVALLFTGLMVWYTTVQLRGGAAGTGGPIAGPVEEQTDDGDAENGSGSSVEWPENLATGGIVFVEQGGEVGVLPSDAPVGDAVPAPVDAAGLGAQHHIRVYLDYRCPFCAFFEEASADTLEQAVLNGDTAVEIHPLTFLDRASADGYYSSRTAGAIECLADAQPEAAWAGHQALLDQSFQPGEGTAGHDNSAILSELDRATGGLNDAARSCIEQERFVPFAQALNDWVFSTPVPGAQDPALEVTGTPLVVVDGVPYPGDPRDGAAFRAFLEQQGVELG
jgi:protein-disulfide isomerase